MFRRILVTTDGSAASETAFPYVAGLARALGSHVVLLHVIPEPDLPVHGEDRERSASQRREAGQRTLDLAAASLGVPARLVLKAASHHDVASTIADTACAEGAEVIVMASHGRTGLNHMLMGNVAERVMHRATVPVLLVRDAVLERRPAHQVGS